MTIAIRILWWVLTLNLEGSLTRVRKKKKNPPPRKNTPTLKPKHTHHYTGKYPTGFQPNPPAPAEAEAPAEPVDPTEPPATTGDQEEDTLSTEESTTEQGTETPDTEDVAE